jgi:hypothetical protein
MSAFGVFALATAVGVPLYAWAIRGRQYATFAIVILVLSLPGAVAMHARLVTWAVPVLQPAVSAVFACAIAATGIHLAALVRPRLHGRPFRLGVSIPGMAFIAAGFLSGLWLLALVPLRAALLLLERPDALAMLRWLDLVPFAVVAFSLVTSARPIHEVVRVHLADEGPPELTRLQVERYRRRAPAPLTTRPLRIVQITDPHLGPWQPVIKLRRLLERLVAHDPDLVLLTGDFLTMEGSGTPGALAEAFTPLRDVAGRCFAIFGNHDHAYSDEVRSALAANGVRLLVDDETAVETPAGRVQIIGADYVGRGHRAHLHALLERFPRRDEHLRILLLHDPIGFRELPEGGADLTLSGHTHGGQLGLVSLGLDWTILSRTAWPDHGLFGRGPNRLYVHRGTGFYGFPLRIGVPGEASVLELVRG